jgi:hypothetical protein
MLLRASRRKARVDQTHSCPIARVRQGAGTWRTRIGVVRTDNTEILSAPWLGADSEVAKLRQTANRLLRAVLWFIRHVLGRTARLAYPHWVGALDFQFFDAVTGTNQLASKVPPGLVELTC